MSALSRKRDAVAEEGVTWLHRLEKGCSDECRADFVRWFKQSALHREQFLITSGLREGLKRLDAQSEIANATGDEGMRAWKSAGRQRAWLRPAGVALGVFVVMVTLAFTLVDRLTTTHDLLVPPSEAGQQIILRDGSTIQLDTRARAEMVTSRRSRELRLYEGEARISVSRNPARPFSLVSGPFVVHDMGTQFVARSQGTGIRVLVLDGSVRLTVACRSAAAASAKSTQAVLVHRQQEVSVPDDRCSSQSFARTLEQREIDQKIAWTLGRFHFDGDRLAEVVERFNRYNAVQLKVDPAVGNRRVSGHFLATDPEGFVRNIEKSLGVKISAVSPGVPQSDVIYLIDSHSRPDLKN